MAPRVGVGLARIGKDAEAVRFRDDGDLFGFGFGVGMVLSGWAAAAACATAIGLIKHGCRRTERKTPGSRELMQNMGVRQLSRALIRPRDIREKVCSIGWTETRT